MSCDYCELLKGLFLTEKGKELEIRDRLEQHIRAEHVLDSKVHEVGTL